MYSLIRFIIAKYEQENYVSHLSRFEHNNYYILYDTNDPWVLFQECDDANLYSTKTCGGCITRSIIYQPALGNQTFSGNSTLRNT
jgi:hypothetical protein